jgi:predicted ATPase
VASLDEGGLRSSLERLAEADILFVEGHGAQATYRFKHALIQDAAYDSLLKSSRQTLHVRAAEILSQSESPEPEAIAHHFTRAGLNDLAIEWWGKAGDQALRRSAFQEAIAHFGKAIAMADKAAGGKAGVSAQRQKLHSAYGNALIAARGPGAPETKEVFTRARERAGGDKDAPERLAVDYGLFVGSLVRGELPAMRAHAAAFLADVEARPNSPEAGVAYRAQGITHWFAGEYVDAREHLERALRLFQPGRDDDLAFRFGYDAGASAMAYLAFASWSLGDVRRARSLIESIQARIGSVTHAGSRASGTALLANFELMLGEPSRVTPHALELVRLASEHNLSMFRAYGAFLEGWAAAHSGTIDEGLEGMRHGVETLRGQNVVLLDGLIKIALAEVEARAGDASRAVAIVDEALATCDRVGNRTFEAELHRVRGALLLTRDPANPTPAEDAFLTAIAIAKQQGTRSFELRAALALAKLYRSTGRLIEVHAILAPALEGFSPTAEMPEITEAQALLTALAEMEEVKAEATNRDRMTRLQVAFGNALIHDRGYGAAETTEAFARARESAVGDDRASERLAADYGLWAGSYLRGELAAMRAHAAVFLCDAEVKPDSPEASVAHRVLGTTHWIVGECGAARDHLERALALFRPGRDDDLAYRFGQDAGVAAMVHLAIALWQLGEVEHAASLVGGAEARIVGLAHVGTHIYAKFHAAILQVMRGDVYKAASSADEFVHVVRAHDLRFWLPHSEFFEGWTKSAGGAPGDGLDDMRRGVEQVMERPNFDAVFRLGLAEFEARAGEFEHAIATIDRALATAEWSGQRAFDSQLHRLRGETLLKRDPSNSGPAEEAFRRAIAVAREQGARSFGLQAAFGLAKLNQSTGRPTEAHAVLAPALEGFAPTKEMPEIAEAQALFAVLEATDEVKSMQGSGGD